MVKKYRDCTYFDFQARFYSDFRPFRASRRIPPNPRSPILRAFCGYVDCIKIDFIGMMEFLELVLTGPVFWR